MSPEPRTDPWAFTSVGALWLNLAWLWDAGMSVLHTHLGWYGQLAFLSLCVGLTLALLYNACLLRSGNGMAAFLAMLLVAISLPLHLRPMQASNLLLALLFLLALLVQHRGWNIAWWYVMPALMPLWVNVHGGFIVAFALLGAFGLQALYEKEWRKAAHFTAAGLLSIAALGASPYGYKGVLDVLVATFTTSALSFISEFRPSVLSWHFLLTYLYIPVFFACMLHRRPKTSLAENILGFGLLIFAATSQRYWVFVYLFSSPLLAQYFAAHMGTGRHRGNPTAMRIAAAAKRWFFYHARENNVRDGNAVDARRHRIPFYPGGSAAGKA